MKIEVDFTDEKITPSGGSVFLHQVASRLGLPSLLEKALHLKVRNRGASDVEMMLSLIYTLTNGDGAISDVDRLAFDTARRQILGLERVPGHRRLGEYLARFDFKTLESFYGVARHLVGKVAPLVVEHELLDKGYIPVFMDGSGIEVYEEYFEKSGSLYNGEKGLNRSGFVGEIYTAPLKNRTPLKGRVKIFFQGGVR